MHLQDKSLVVVDVGKKSVYIKISVFSVSVCLDVITP
jgi:hypothetical protein